MRLQVSLSSSASSLFLVPHHDCVDGYLCAHRLRLQELIHRCGALMLPDASRAAARARSSPRSIRMARTDLLRRWPPCPSAIDGTCAESPHRRSLERSTAPHSGSTLPRRPRQRRRSQCTESRAPCVVYTRRAVLAHTATSARAIGRTRGVFRRRGGPGREEVMLHQSSPRARLAAALWCHPSKLHIRGRSPPLPVVLFLVWLDSASFSCGRISRSFPRHPPHAHFVGFLPSQTRGHSARILRVAHRRPCAPLPDILRPSLPISKRRRRCPPSQTRVNIQRTRALCPRYHLYMGRADLPVSPWMGGALMRPCLITRLRGWYLSDGGVFTAEHIFLHSRTPVFRLPAIIVSVFVDARYYFCTGFALIYVRIVHSHITILVSMTEICTVTCTALTSNTSPP
ncbi:hypothetical protein DFH07DRAFT_1058390 [Mycena maculata]|uniref:Uncharacterized protein n=1 Tax=Mycena maculata TaxID=230809 RepID=A0AAD7JRR0_9AGAR|nr:hypothetical protein DFH07DRAFT_1058390 [Mycena maculata]